jgi:hypothetical protein
MQERRTGNVPVLQAFSVRKYRGDILIMKAPREDRRNLPRIDQSQIVRIRPVESEFAEEIRPTLNVTRDGLYFATSMGHYFAGMIVHVARDFQSLSPASQDRQATVVRVDQLKEGRWGVEVVLASKDWAKAAA